MGVFGFGFVFELFGVSGFQGFRDVGVHGLGLGNVCRVYRASYIRFSLVGSGGGGGYIGLWDASFSG